MVRRWSFTRGEEIVGEVLPSRPLNSGLIASLPIWLVVPEVNGILGAMGSFSRRRGILFRDEDKR
jgi:hypothetical protein